MNIQMNENDKLMSGFTTLCCCTYHWTQVCVCVSSIHTIYINIYIYTPNLYIYIYRHRFTRFTYINYDYWWLISIIVSRHRRLWLSHPSERGVQFPQSHGGVEAPTLGNGSMPGYSFLEWKLYTYMIIYIYVYVSSYI